MDTGDEDLALLFGGLEEFSNEDMCMAFSDWHNEPQYQQYQQYQQDSDQHCDVPPQTKSEGLGDMGSGSGSGCSAEPPTSTADRFQFGYMPPLDEGLKPVSSPAAPGHAPQPAKNKPQDKPTGIRVSRYKQRKSNMCDLEAAAEAKLKEARQMEKENHRLKLRQMAMEHTLAAR